MFSGEYPIFSHGRLLKKEMFENIRDFSKDFIDIKFRDYSDGIIVGANAIIKDHNIIVTRGLVKQEGRVYILDKDYTLPYYSTNKEMIIKVRFIDKALDDSFEMYNTEIFLDEDTEVKRDEIEIGRFKIKEGAVLISAYNSFEDLDAEYNAINIVNVSYSGLKKSTIHPLILKYFSLEVLKEKAANSYDIAFCMECINNSIIDKEDILHYLFNRLEIEYKDYSNKEIYNYLLQILKRKR